METVIEKVCEALHESGKQANWKTALLMLLFFIMCSVATLYILINSPA